MRQTLVLLICGFAACGDQRPPGPLAADEPGGPAAEPAADIGFADGGLEAAVRQALAQPTGPLRREALRALESLDASDRAIADLGGIEHLGNLVLLDLADNRIADIAPLARLAWLQFLFVERNRIADLSPVAGLTLLEVFLFDGNRVHDLGPLLPLGARGSLERVGLADNPLSIAERQGQVASLRAAGIDPAPGDDLRPDPPAADTPAPIPPPAADTPVFRILFQSTRRNPEAFQFGLYVMDADGGQVTELFADGAAGVNPIAASWSPDGQRLAFAQDGALYTAGADGNDLRRIAADLLDTSLPQYSPDGTLLAFFLFGPDATALATIPLAGGPHREIIDFSAALGGDLRFIDRGLAWSPDGRLIAFSVFVEGRSEIFAAELASGTLINLSQTPDHNDFGPRWSPDGRSVLFFSNADGDNEIYRADLDGAPPRNLSDHPAGDRAPQFFPDGRRILFSSSRHGGTDFFVMDADGQNPVNITNTREQEIGALISPDGAHIALTRNTGDNVEIFVADADGQNPVNVTNSPGGDWMIAWSPR